MIYRLLLESPEEESFECAFDIDGKSSLESLHQTILEFLDYPRYLFTSFIYCDASFNVLEELSLEDVKERNVSVADAFSDDTHDVVYVFDTLLERCFFVNVVEKKEGEIDTPKLLHVKGKIPAAQLSNREVAEFITKDFDEDALLVDDIFEEEELENDMDFDSCEDDDLGY